MVQFTFEGSIPNNLFFTIFAYVLVVGGLAEKNRRKLQIGPNSQDMFGISF